MLNLLKATPCMVNLGRTRRIIRTTPCGVNLKAEPRAGETGAGDKNTKVETPNLPAPRPLSLVYQLFFDNFLRSAACIGLYVQHINALRQTLQTERQQLRAGAQLHRRLAQQTAICAGETETYAAALI